MDSRDMAKARRIEELHGWTLKELIARRDELGLTMDPTEGYSLPEAIAKEEIQGELGPDFRPNQQMRMEMYDYLATRYGIETVNALEFPWADNTLAQMRMAVGGHGAPFDATDEDLPQYDNPYGFKTVSGWFIYEVLVPEFLRYFAKKNADYGDQHRSPDGLGVKGEFPGLRRRVSKLKRTLWDGEEMNHEGPEEMIHDLIGTCFIILDLMNQEKQQGSSTNGENMQDPVAY